MKVYRALVNICDLTKKDKEVIVKQGELLTFEDESRAKKAIQNNVVREISVYELKGSLDEKTKKETEDTEDDNSYQDLTNDELRNLLDERKIEYKASDKKEVLIRLLSE